LTGTGHGQKLGKMNAATLFDGRAVGVGPSAIHGSGVIARRDFAIGDVVAQLSGPLKRGRFDPDTGPNWVGIGPDCWIDPEAPFVALNHCCMPNAAFGAGRCLFALRAIAAGEEVTADYATTECDPVWSMRCSCGATSCRGIIVGIQFTFDVEPAASPLMRLVWRKRRERPAFFNSAQQQSGERSAHQIGQATGNERLDAKLRDGRPLGGGKPAGDRKLDGD
jgi:uncharacterized protein